MSKRVFGDEVYSPADLKLLTEGKRRPISLWEGWRMARLSAPEKTPWVCRGVNTPEEFKEAQNYLTSKEND